MLFVYVRILVKLLFFLFGTIFIVFYVVYGYRYNKNIGFIKHNVVVKFIFWQDNSSIGFDNKLYKTQKQEINLYNLEPGCYNVNYNGENFINCLKNDEIFTDVFVLAGNKNLIENKEDIICDKYQQIPFDKKSINNRYFSKKLSNVFEYRKIKFVQTIDSLYYCNNDYSICKYLSDFKGEIICGNSNGLVFYDSNYYQFQLY